jgi:hypothetical protein
VVANSLKFLCSGAAKKEERGSRDVLLWEVIAFLPASL